MLLPLWVVSQYFSYQQNRKFLPILVNALLIIVLILLLGFSIGVFSLDVNSLEEWGYGYYSWNINGFINPLSTSSVINSINLGTKGQYEGYSYLGLGNILLLIIGYVIYIQNDFRKSHLKFYIPLLISSIFFLLLAASNQVYLNDKLLWEIELSKKIEFLSVDFSSIWQVCMACVLSDFSILNRCSY